MLIHEQGGYLPKWEFANGWTGCMIGSHVDIVLSDVITKREFDPSTFSVQKVMEACRTLANGKQPHDGRWDPDTYKKYTYIPSDLRTSETVSESLSYAYDDWAIGNIANYLHLDQEAQDYYNRSKWYRSSFDPKTKFFCPRSTQNKFDCPKGLERIYPGDKRYTEGNAWQYRFFVPQDPAGLIELFGGKAEFVKELDKFMSRAKYFTSYIIPDFYYWQGNEPDFFSPFMFAYADRPDLTQKYVRWVLEASYTNTPHGLAGDDDYGTLSAWYLFARYGTPVRPAIAIFRAWPASGFFRACMPRVLHGYCLV